MHHIVACSFSSSSEFSACIAGGSHSLAAAPAAVAGLRPSQQSQQLPLPSPSRTDIYNLERGRPVHDEVLSRCNSIISPWLYSDSTLVVEHEHQLLVWLRRLQTPVCFLMCETMQELSAFSVNKSGVLLTPPVTCLVQMLLAGHRQRLLAWQVPRGYLSSRCCLAPHRPAAAPSSPQTGYLIV